ncbi:MAG: hypothetical protein ACTSU5_01875 [Promethearchaeota archaeon]
MTIDIIKFFQAFVRQLADIGGINLPKTVSTSLGGRLAETYERKHVTEWKDAITGMIQGMGGTIEIEGADAETSEKVVVKVSYFHDFCPIGGHPMSSKADLVQGGVCIPYLMGFLRPFFPGTKMQIRFTKCIVRDGGNQCHAELTLSS